MKKFGLHCNGYGVVARFFKSNFCLYVKGRYTWNQVDKQKKKLSEPANFSASLQTNLGRNLPTVQNYPKK